MRRRFKTKYQHWLDVAVDRFDQDTLNDIKAVYRVGALFLLYPMYWALYDQQGSRWTIQVLLTVLAAPFFLIIFNRQ